MLSQTRSQNHRTTSAGGELKDHRAAARCPGLAVSSRAGCPGRSAAGRHSSVPAAAPHSSGTDCSSAAAQPRQKIYEQKIYERLRPLSPAPPRPRRVSLTHSLTGQNGLAAAAQRQSRKGHDGGERGRLHGPGPPGRTAFRSGGGRGRPGGARSAGSGGPTACVL